MSDATTDNTEPDGRIEAVVMVAEQDGPQAAAKHVAHEIGIEAGDKELSAAANGAFGQRHQTLAAVLSELRKAKSESESAPEADACSALSCRATDRLQRIDGRVLCDYHAVEYRQR
jgi:hypothetical protein